MPSEALPAGSGEVAGLPLTQETPFPRRGSWSAGPSLQAVCNYSGCPVACTQPGSAQTHSHGQELAADPGHRPLPPHSPKHEWYGVASA